MFTAGREKQSYLLQIWHAAKSHRLISPNKNLPLGMYDDSKLEKTINKTEKF